MRTAVVRIDVDPTGRLTPDELASGMAALVELAGDSGVEVIDTNIAAMPVRRRHAQLLIAGTESQDAMQSGIQLCAKAFGTKPAAGVITYVSRGTDDDVHGVLAGFGLSGGIRREQGAEGLDVVHVTLSEPDVQRVGESRLHTALEASLNCEVHIHTS